jgi:hypothetical protein
MQILKLKNLYKNPVHILKMIKILFINSLSVFYFLNVSLGQQFGQAEPLTDFSEKILRLLSKNDSVTFLNFTSANKEALSCFQKIADTAQRKLIDNLINDNEIIKREWLRSWRRFYNNAIKEGVDFSDIRFKNSYIYHYNETYKLRIEFTSNKVSYVIRIKELAFCDHYYVICDAINIGKELKND